MSVPGPHSRQVKPLGAGAFQPEIGSFRLCLAAEGKSAKTVRMYTEAVQWLAAAHLTPATSWTRWEQVSGQDVQRWMVWVLGRYSDSYASNQYRALQQFFEWWAGEEGLPNPMARLRPPRVTEKLWPGSSTTPRIRSAVTSTCGGGRSRSGARAVRRGSSGSATTPQSALTTTSGSGPACPGILAAAVPGVNNRGPVTASGIYQMIVRRGRQCGVAAYPHRFRHHFSRTWLDRGGAEGDLMELNGWTSPQMLRRYSCSARSARARRSYDRIMDPIT